jgi:hypothetical protein
MLFLMAQVTADLGDRDSVESLKREKQDPLCLLKEVA